MDIIEYKILQVLSDNQYHSGEKLANLFKTSRASICKRIAKLKKDLNQFTDNNLNIISITGKGYCLNSQFDSISTDLIQDRIFNPNTIVQFFPTIGSTNDYLINSEINDNQYYVCLTEHQTKGRGRNTINTKKSWYSPFGHNIYCSLAWHYPGNQSSLLGLSLIAGITVAELITDLGCLDVGVKWPNDILINNQKVAGILTEIYGDPNGGCKLVIGFGINIHNPFNNSPLFNKHIDQPWTTVAEHVSKSLSRNDLITKLLNNFIVNYELFIKHGLSFFIDIWHKFDYLKGCAVNVTVANKIKPGKYLGIDNSGAVIINIGGQEQVFHSGEISVRATNDYIN